MKPEVICPDCQTIRQLPSAGAGSWICPRCQWHFSSDVPSTVPHSEEERTAPAALTASTTTPLIECDNEADLSRLKEWHAESYLVRKKWVPDNEWFVVFLMLSGMMLACFILFLTACAMSRW